MFELDHFVCIYPGCGKHSISAAHVIPKRPNAPHLDDPSNGASLCIDHHDWFDDGHTFDVQSDTGITKVRMTGMQIKDMVLTSYLGRPNYRWIDSHAWVRMKLGKEAPVCPTT